MKIKDVIEFIEARFPLLMQEDYDNSGLQVGDSEDRITGALVCIDATNEVIDEAVAEGLNLVISHHPLIFGGIKQVSNNTLAGSSIIKAIRNGINIYSIHTNLDNSNSGLNKWLCNALGIARPRILRRKTSVLRKIVTFCPAEHAGDVRTALFNAGAGTIGNYDCCSFNTKGHGTFRALPDANPFVGNMNQLHFEPEERIEAIYPVHNEQAIIQAMIEAHPYEEVAYDILLLGNADNYSGSGMIGETEEQQAYSFLQKVSRVCGIPCIRHQGDLNKTISRVAVCGGSGSFLIADAISQKADIFLTGDIKYHDFRSNSSEMILADIGHFESEQFGKDLLLQMLNEKFTTFAVRKSERDTNPVGYLFNAE
ncbi:MAG TPA: Nif3-like dinuclear metal center hexameric protein [Bacteroidales bacterium]|nr:Nif3-like dinuclear metal center hexameric protein [Bacteroidales bacterium]